MNKGLLAIGVVLLGTSAAPVGAQEACACPDGNGLDWNPSFYVGAGLQHSAFEDWGFARVYDSNSYTSSSEDANAGGYSVNAGVDFLKYFALEASYVDFGEARFTGQSDGTSFWGPGPQRESMAMDGYALHLIGRFPVVAQMAVVGKIGRVRWERKYAQSGSFYDNGPSNPAVPYDFTGSETGTSNSYGAGLEYDGFLPLRLTAEYRVTSFETAYSDFLGQEPEIRSPGLFLKYVF